MLSDQKVLPSVPDGHAGNSSQFTYDEKAKKKKCIILSVGATIIVIAIIAILLAVVLREGDDPEPPGPKPPGPIPPDAGVNPYDVVKDGNFRETASSVSGPLKSNNHYLEDLRKLSMLRTENGG